jgi:hypothetical protein
MAYLKRGVVALVGLWLAFGSIGTVWAQSDRGAITGSVTDPSGAVIVAATVTATNTGTGVSKQTQTTTAGDYTIPLLRAGTYSVTVEHPGLKRFIQSGIVLEVGQTIRVDAPMQIGQTTQTVQVTGQGELLQRDTSDRGTVIGSRDIEELPIVSQGEQRNPGFYMTLAPGVTGRGTAAPTASGSGRQLNTTVNGSPSGSTEFHLDGAQIGQGYMLAGDFRLLPFPPDAVGEFNVMTLNPPAEYGQTGLGITSFSIKSGSNQLHGTMYEYLRNNDLDARGFFAPTTPVNKQNEFGATVGGPVVIPKIYNGKDKTFFFGWYHGFRLRNEPSNSLDTVPTEAMRGGDLSNLLNPLTPISSCGSTGKQACYDALGRPIYSNEIYDPSTQRIVAAGAIDPVTGLRNTSGSSAIIRDGFGFNNVTGVPTSSANIIPSSRLDPMAVKMFTYFPNPTLPGRQFGYIDNWLSAYLAETNINQWGSKVDHNVSSKQHLMGEFIWWNSFNPSGSKWPGAISNGGIAYENQDIARFVQDYTFRPNLINHWVFGFNRIGSVNQPEAGTGWPGKLGYAGVPQSGTGSTFPELNIGGLGNLYASSGQSYSGDNSFSFDDGLSWITGKHTVKAGFGYIKLQDNNWSATYQSSFLTFNAGTTSLPGPAAWYNDSCPAGGQCTGLGAAGFLLGDVSTGTAGITAATTADRNGRYAWYVEDNFKYSPRLTLNLGVRYDLLRPNVDAHNAYSWVDPDAMNTALGVKGAMVFATPGNRAPVSASLGNIGPRIGLAYALNEKTVIRSGYGILYTAGGAERAVGSDGQLGYNASNALPEKVVAGFSGLLPVFQLNNGWPSSKFVPPPFISQSYGIGQGPFFGGFPGDGKLPSVQTWDFDIQRQLGGGILIDAAYVGTKGTHLPSRLMNSNVMPTKYVDTFLYTSGGQPKNHIFDLISDPAVQALSVVQAMPVDPTTGDHSPFKGFEALWGGSATLGQSLRPFPQYTTDTTEGLSQMRDFGEGVGNSSYNAFQLQARKHFSQGLTFLVSYTWSKTLTDAGSIFNEFSGFTQDFYNAKLERSLSINDYPNNLVISYEYQLPFGPGKKWANEGGAAGKLVGGWGVAGVQQYQSGAPQMIASGDNPLNPYSGPNSFLSRPNIVPGVPKKSAALLAGKWDPNGTVVNGVDYGAVLNVAAWSNPASNAANPWTLGDAPPTDGTIRRFPFYNEDISVLKRTSINERLNLEFRADFLNIFNRTLFGFDEGGDQYGSILQGNQVSAGLGGFGHVTSQSNFPREIQFGLKLT